MRIDDRGVCGISAAEALVEGCSHGPGHAHVILRVDDQHLISRSDNAGIAQAPTARGFQPGVTMVGHAMQALCVVSAINVVHHVLPTPTMWLQSMLLAG